MEQHTGVVAEQRTDLWDKARCGKFTASEAYKLIGEPRVKTEVFTETAKTYIMKKVGEELVGYAAEMTSLATAWGIEHEPQARKWYEKLTGNKVNECGFNDSGLGYGGSPDGAVGDDGLIEIKCPYNTENHIYNVITDVETFKSNLKDYYWQMQMNMMVTGRKWCDFITFDPRIDFESGMHIKRLLANEEDFDLLKEKLALAQKYKEGLLLMLKKK